MRAPPRRLAEKEHRRVERQRHHRRGRRDLDQPGRLGGVERPAGEAPDASAATTPKPATEAGRATASNRYGGERERRGPRGRSPGSCTAPMRSTTTPPRALPSAEAMPKARKARLRAPPSMPTLRRIGGDEGEHDERRHRPEEGDEQRPEHRPLGGERDPVAERGGAPRQVPRQPGNEADQPPAPIRRQ